MPHPPPTTEKDDLMDDGKGRLREITPEKAQKLKGQLDGPSVFIKGDILKVRNSIFKIQSVGERILTLKLMPKGTLVDD